MLTYSLDFLYAKIPPGQIKQNELRELEEKLGKLIKLIDSYYNNEEGLYRSSIKESPLKETRYALFSINLIEDIIQDAIHYHNANLNPIVKIYGTQFVGLNFLYYLIPRFEKAEDIAIYPIIITNLTDNVF